MHAISSKTNERTTRIMQAPDSLYAQVLRDSSGGLAMAVRSGFKDPSMDIQWCYPTANNTTRRNILLTRAVELMDPNTGFWGEQLGATSVLGGRCAAHLATPTNQGRNDTLAWHF